MSDIRGVGAVITNLGRIKNQSLKKVENVIGVFQALVANDARDIVPVKTSTLQKSIQPGRLLIDFSGEVTGEVVADEEYATFVEFGTSKQSPQPYMIPAMLKNMDSFRRQLAGELR